MSNPASGNSDQAVTFQWDFEDETANSTTNQINRQKSARNLIIRDFDPSGPHGIFFDPKRDKTHRASLNQCRLLRFHAIKDSQTMHAYLQIGNRVGTLEAKYLDERALSSVTAGQTREETDRLQRLPSDSMQWGKWSIDIQLPACSVNRQYRAYSIHHVEHSIIKTDDGWLIHQYPISLDSCGCADFSERRLPCKHIYAAAIASGISLPFTFTEFQEARDRGLGLVFEFGLTPSEIRTRKPYEPLEESSPTRGCRIGNQLCFANLRAATRHRRSRSASRDRSSVHEVWRSIQ